MAHAASIDGITLRTHRPGDIGHIISRHGALYSKEYGWDCHMEALVARTCADFIDTYDPALERLWIAEREGGEFVGCVMLFNEKDEASQNSAMLRLLLVEPADRGKGVGKMMASHAVEFAREAGYPKVVVWMQSSDAAREIYRKQGFRKVTDLEHEAFGAKLAVELWALMFDQA